MCDMNPDVQLALMTLYLAATSAAVPIGIAFFGSGDHRGSTDRVFEVTPISSGSKEEVKALIAGYEGITGAEFLHWAIQKGEANLAARSESKKVLIVIHDGKPVYKEEDGDDWELSCTRLLNIECRSITPVGVYLGNNPEDLVQLKTLFPRFIHTTGNALPERLGLLLRGLAR
jgi:nitric oxide reductase activation protein